MSFSSFRRTSHRRPQGAGMASHRTALSLQSELSGGRVDVSGEAGLEFGLPGSVQIITFSI